MAIEINKTQRRQPFHYCPKVPKEKQMPRQKEKNGDKYIEHA
jgi:hypothetical protein